MPRKIFMFLPILSMAAAIAAQSAEAPREPREVLGNYDVIELIKAGLSEPVVLAKIAGSEVDFDTSTDAIVALKRAKVPENVITAMIVRETGTRSGDSRGARAPQPDPDSSLTVDLRAGGETHRLEGTIPRDRYVNAVVALLWFKRLKGEEASTVIQDPKPVISIPRSHEGANVNLSGVFLVKLDVDHDEEAREYRLDWGTPFRFVVDMMPEEDYLVRTESEEADDRILITPGKPLGKGQYALIDEQQVAYDFAVK